MSEDVTDNTENKLEKLIQVGIDKDKQLQLAVQGDFKNYEYYGVIFMLLLEEIINQIASKQANVFGDLIKEIFLKMKSESEQLAALDKKSPGTKEELVEMLKEALDKI